MPIDRQRQLEGFLFLFAFAACVPLANFMVGHVGVVCLEKGPCLVPVAPGLMAPSGVLMVGLALVLRDLVQRRLGALWGLGAIMVGGALSWLFSPPGLVIASVAAFILSELADFAVFTPLQRRGLILAAMVSSLLGLVVDSVVFLMLAFNNLDFLAGQVVGKSLMVLATIPVLYWVRQRDAKLGADLTNKRETA